MCYIRRVVLHNTWRQVEFFMLELSIRKKIEHRFHADRDKGKLGIGYDMIIGCDLMVQLSL